ASRRGSPVWRRSPRRGCRRSFRKFLRFDRYPETVIEPVVVDQRELALAVVALLDRAGREAELQQALAQRVEVLGSPVEAHSLVAVRPVRGAGAPVQQDPDPTVADAAADQPSLAPFLVPRIVEAEPLTPQPETAFEVGARHDGEAAGDRHPIIHPGMAAAWRIQSASCLSSTGPPSSIWT